MHHHLKAIPETPGAALRLLMAATLIVALCVPALALTGPAQGAAARNGDTVELVRDGTWIEYDGYRTASMHDGQTGNQIICAQPARDSPESGTYVKDYDGIDEQIEATSKSPTWANIRKFLVRALIYYAHPDSPGFDTSLFSPKNWEGENWTREDYIAMLHLSLSAAYDNSFAAAMKDTSAAFRSWAIANVTGGFANGDETDGKDIYYANSIWGKLLAYDGADLAGWNGDANPYYAELPEGFSVYILHPGSADQVCFGFDALGWAAVEKKSSAPAITAGNRIYSFEGAVYGIFADRACTEEVARMTVDASGAAKSGALVPGTYFVRELSAPYGYTLDESVAKIEVEACETASFSSAETPKYALPELLVQKGNLETGNAAAVAGGTLEDARFLVSYYDDFDGTGTPTRSWTFRSDARGEVSLDEAHLVEGDALYTDANGKPAFPLGHYTVEETAPPEGYLRDEEVRSFDLRDTDDDGQPIVTFSHALTIGDQVRRGDFELRKVDDQMNGMANVPFMVSYDNEGDGTAVERHVVVTDVNGEFSSAANPHSARTNANDEAVARTAAGGWFVDESKLDADAGLWFSMDRTGACAKPDDAHGALPYGSYLLEELPCAANEGKTLVTTGFFVDDDGAHIDLGNLVDHSPSLETEALDRSDADKRIDATENAHIVDTVRYRDLVPGTVYELTGTVMVKSTGEPLTRADGKIVSVLDRFTTERADGTRTVELAFDASGLAGQELVVFETLSADGQIVAAHEDLNDADQTVRVLPKIATAAADKADGDSYIMGTQATIVDTVSYEGLDAGSTYKLDALLMDKTTGNVARDAEGTAISASREFTPETGSGTVEVEIALDTVVVGGHDVVVFEKLLDADDFLLASHEDLEDSAQTLKTAGIDTVATDAADGDHQFDTTAQRVTIADTVSYANLEPGSEYTLTGTLVDKTTGQPLEADGSPVTSTRTFTPEHAGGNVEMELAFDPSLQAACDVVVFESLRYQGNEIAAHAQLDDEDQTVVGIIPDGAVPLEDGPGAVGTGDEDLLPWVVAAVIAVTTACAAGALRYRNRLGDDRDMGVEED